MSESVYVIFQNFLGGMPLYPLVPVCFSHCDSAYPDYPHNNNMITSLHGCAPLFKSLDLPLGPYTNRITHDHTCTMYARYS